MTGKKVASLLYNKIGQWFEVVRVVLQFLIGLFIFYTVIIKGIYFLNIFTPEAVLSKYVIETSILVIISKSMLASAAIELGYMLFTPGPDEAIDPLILGITGSSLFALSDNSSTLFGSSYFETSLVTLLFSICLIGLFFLRWKCKVWFPKEMGDEKE